MSKALENIVVVEITREFFASLTGALLGDFGATVIRMEDLADPRLDRESGRVWLVTAGDLPPRYDACFEPRFAMSPVRPYRGAGMTERRLSVLYLGTNCTE